jgi:predicted CxxxxCH...CXXCH cytochrome family protein
MKKILLLLAAILVLGGMTLLDIKICLSIGEGDGYLLRRSHEEICHACHKTNQNTPSPGETGYVQANWGNAIKAHSAELLGNCSISTYKTRQACVANGGTWTPGKWAGSGGWGVTGGKYGEFVCTTCHTAHDTRNIYLTKETIATPDGSNWASSGTTTVAPLFKKRAIADSPNPGVSDGEMGNDSGGHTTSTKVCEVCHSQNKFHNYNTANNTGGNNHENGNNCSLCHSHKIAFMASCRICHNSPPTTGKHGAHFATGTASYGATTILSTTTAYGFSCGICHYGTHLNTLPQLPNPHAVEIVFAGLATQDLASGSPAYAPGAFSVDDPDTGWTFNYSDGTCSNTYCHGNYPGSGLNASPTFETGTASCGTCHKATNTTPPNTGNHNKHAVTSYYEFKCTLCHKNAVGGSSPASYTVVDKSKHVNGYVDWGFDTTDTRVSGGTYSIPSGTAMPSNGVTPRAYGTCNNVYCHSNVQPDGGVGGPSIYATPTWGTTITDCGPCHAGGHGNLIATGSHSAHLNYTFTTTDVFKCGICHSWDQSQSLNCVVCHNFSATTEYAKHANYKIEVMFDQAFNSSASYGKSPSFTPGTGYSNCSNTYCHSNGTSVATGTIPANTTPDWGSGTLTCNGCHGNAIYADYRRAGPLYADGSPKKNAHQLHIRASGSTVTDPSCAMCHYSVTTDNTTIANKSLHVNKAYNISASGASIQYPAWAGAGTGSNAAVTITTYTYNSSVSTCTSVSCHPDGLSGTTTKWSTGYSCTDCHNINMNNTSGYHHVMYATAMTDRTYPTSAPTTSEADSNRKCTMCHVDHDIFSPMLNVNNTNGRSYNLRTAIGTTPTSTTGYINSDYIAGGGICISCHNTARSKNTTAQADDGTTETVAVTNAQYSTSAHQYSVSSTMSNGGSTYNANCSKCHNAKNGETTTFQSSANKFGTHDNTLRRLFASLGMTSPTDPEEEDFCYRCHSKTTDTTPGGGPAKGTAGRDYYGTAGATMTAAAEDIFTVMQLGTAGTPEVTTTTNTLYLKSATDATPTEPMSNAYILASGTYSNGSTTYWGRTMSPGEGTNGENRAQNTSSNTNRYYRVAQFTSPAVKNLVSFTTAQSFTLYFSSQESNINANMYVRYALWVWNSADTEGTNWRTVATGAQEVGNNTTGKLMQTITFNPSANFALNPNDKVLLEVEFTNTGTTSCTATAYWGNANATDISRLVFPSDVDFITTSATPASGRHVVASYNGKHKPSPLDEDVKFTTNRHVECADCHNPHAAKQGTHTPSGQWYPTSPSSTTNNVSNAITGVTGIEPTWPSIWTVPTTFTSLSSATKESQICFKCHSYKGLQAADGVSIYITSDVLMTDQAMEFNPKNYSLHPVTINLGNTTVRGTGSGAPYAPLSLTANQMLAPWTNVGSQTMYCSDCHGTDNENAGDPKGPHASSYKYMLKGPNKYWPTKSDGTTLWELSDVTSTGPADLFCRNCHPIRDGSGWKNNVHSQSMGMGGGHQNITCVECHVAVPHGAKRSRLIGYGTNATNPDPAPYDYNGNSLKITGFRKASSPTDYNQKGPGDHNCTTSGIMGCHGNSITDPDP